jgi:hypothetical protein
VKIYQPVTEIRMSNTTKTILIVLGVIVLCCCVIGAGGFIAFNNVIRSIEAGDLFNSDPGQISQVTADLPDYDVPAGFQEEYVMDVFGLFQGVFISSQSRGAMIMMMQINDSFLGGLEGYEEQFQESFIQQYQVEDITLNQVGERDIEIDGHQTTLAIFEGSDADGYEYIQWVTYFPGDNGTVMVVILGSAVTWSDAEMESFLNTID